MELLELFNLIWTNRNDMGFGSLLSYGPILLTVLCLVGSVLEHRSTAACLSNRRVQWTEAERHALQQSVAAYHKEVAQWEEAARRS